jgi:very-short-patch-repair endonuclease
VTDDEIKHLVTIGHWRRHHRGVYSPAGVFTEPIVLHAAALAAAGPGAAASHRSAAWLCDIVDQAPSRPELTVPSERRPRLPGLTIHRSSDSLPPIRRKGLACTDATRTLIDLATVVSPTALANAVDRALVSQLTAVSRLEEATTPAATRHRKGQATLRRVLLDHGYLGTPVPSVLELRMARLMTAWQLPVVQPQLRWNDGRYRLDYAFEDRQLAIEVDGYVWHASPSAKQADHARHNALVSAGWVVLVYTWKQVVDEPDTVAAQIMENYRRLAT